MGAAVENGAEFPAHSNDYNYDFTGDQLAINTRGYTRTSRTLASPHVVTMLRAKDSTEGFAASIHRQSWEWFLELSYRLELAAEIVDDKGVPILALIDSHGASTLRRLLTMPGNATLRSAISIAMQSKVPQSVTVEQLSVACFPLAVPGSGAGALVLGRGGEPLGLPTDALQKIGSWLAPAIEAHLANVSGEGDDTLDRVSALHRLLNRAVAAGSVRNLVRVFAEALAVWDDVEVRGYVEGIGGEFVSDVTLAGTNRDEAPTAIDDELVHDEMALARLSSSDAERLGFRGDHDVLIARVSEKEGTSWLIVLSGRIAAHDESRLALYVDLLREAARHAEGIAASRLQWAILQHLLVATDDVESAGRAALGEVDDRSGGGRRGVDGDDVERDARVEPRRRRGVFRSRRRRAGPAASLDHACARSVHGRAGGPWIQGAGFHAPRPAGGR